MWWLGGLFLVLLFLFIFQLFGPNPRIIVSPQTTYITKPLGPDGLPDYEQYVLDLHRDGVTPENNAGVLLLRALWPGELDPSQYAAVVTELGMEQMPSRDEALVPLHDNSNRERIAGWLSERARDNDAEIDSLEVETDSNAADPDTVIDQTMSRPWTSEQIPPLAEWIADNQRPLDMIVEASRRPRYYQPSPTLINNRRDLLIEVLLPHVQSARGAARALSARAMWHLGEGRHMDAWHDLLALHRLARLVGQGRTLVEQLVAIAISGIACDGTLTLLHHGELTVEQARQVMHDLATLENFSAVADSLDQMERTMYLDIITRFSRGYREKTQSGFGIDDQLSYLTYVAVDWNIVLRKGNQYYDRCVAAARLPTRAAREQAFSQFEGDVMRLQRDFSTPAALFSAAISPSARGDAVASIMLSLFLPALNSAMNAQDRGNTTLELTRLAAALAAYRAEHGEYPQQLDDLVPGVLEALPLDLYNAKAFLYKRTGDGYLLYSAGENGTDDGGSSGLLNTFQGRELEDLDEAESEKLRTKIPTDADDISIRPPRPLLELPKIAQPAEEQ
jgi:type II secretory pathway pseudopilin PulG